MLVVKTSATRKSAELSVLAAFSKRQPDNCEFHLKSIGGVKEAWMAGAKAGTETAFELILRSVENMRKKCGINKPTIKRP